MFRPILRVAATLFLLAWVLPTVSFSNWLTLVLAAVVLTLLFSLVKPILSVVFLPINVITFGLFSVVIQVVLLWLVTFLVPGFVIQPMVVFGLALNQFFTFVLISSAITVVQSIIKFLF